MLTLFLLYKYTLLFVTDKLIDNFQMGTNKCASQEGMNPYGQARQIYDAREAKRLENAGQSYGGYGNSN